MLPFAPPSSSTIFPNNSVESQYGGTNANNESFNGSGLDGNYGSNYSSNVNTSVNQISPSSLDTPADLNNTPKPITKEEIDAMLAQNRVNSTSEPNSLNGINTNVEGVRQTVLDEAGRRERGANSNAVAPEVPSDPNVIEFYIQKSEVQFEEWNYNVESSVGGIFEDSCKAFLEECQTRGWIIDRIVWQSFKENIDGRLKNDYIQERTVMGRCAGIIFTVELLRAILMVTFGNDVGESINGLTMGAAFIWVIALWYPFYALEENRRQDNDILNYVTKQQYDQKFFPGLTLQYAAFNARIFKRQEPTEIMYRKFTVTKVERI